MAMSWLLNPILFSVFVLHVAAKSYSLPRLRSINIGCACFKTMFLTVLFFSGNEDT